MADGEIKITITGNIGKKDVGGSPQSDTASDESGTVAKESAKNTAFFIFAQQMYQQAQKVGMRAINNVGNLTGDYILQSRVNTAMNAVSFFGGLLVAAKLGPVGLGVWAVSTAVDEGLRQFEFAANQEKAKIQRDFILNKNGQALRDNSRGGF
jgi:hypothetical protein